MLKSLIVLKFEAGECTYQYRHIPSIDVSRFRAAPFSLREVAWVTYKRYLHIPKHLVDIS